MRKPQSHVKPTSHPTKPRPPTKSGSRAPKKPSLDETEMVCNCISFITNVTQRRHHRQFLDTERGVLGLASAGAEFATFTLAQISATTPEILSSLRGLGTVSRLVFDSFCRQLEAGAAKTIIGTALGNAKSLQKVKFNYTEIKEELARTIADGLASSKVSSVCLSDCGFRPNPQIIFSALSHLEWLKSLRLEKVMISDSDLSLLSKTLPTLQSLKLRVVMCRPNLGVLVGSMFANSRGCALLRLDVRSVELGDEGAAALAGGLIKCFPHGTNSVLQSLDLRICSIHEAGGMKVAELVATCPRLERIDISRNQIGERAGEALGKALHSVGVRLKYLDVSGCDLGRLGVAAVCRSLSKSTTSLMLNLAANATQKQSHKPALSTLLSNKSESRLSLILASFWLDNNEVTALSHALAKSRTLYSLKLKQNPLLAAGVRTLIGALPRTLQSLCLCGCEIGNEGAREVSALVRRGKLRLVNLCVKRNGIGPTGVAEIAGAVGGSKEIRKLSLAENAAGREGAEEIANRLIRPAGKLEVLDIRRMGMNAGVTTIANAIAGRAKGCSLRKIRVYELLYGEKFTAVKARVAPEGLNVSIFDYF